VAGRLGSALRLDCRAGTLTELESNALHLPDSLDDEHR